MNTRYNTKHGDVEMIMPLYYCDESLYKTIKDCISSLKKHYPDIKLTVIDDCSPLEHDFEVSYRNKKNMGFTATVNKGLKLSTGKIIIVANDDLLFKEGDLDKFFMIQNIGIFSPRDSASGNSDTFGAIWGMNRDTYNILGPLDENYRDFFSDKDYYDRAKKMNIPIYKWRDICIEHKESSTYNLVDKNKLLAEDSIKYSQKN